MCKTNCTCAPAAPDLGEAIRQARGQRNESTDQRVARLTGAFKVGVSPASDVPRAAAAPATAPSPDWADALRAARQ
jgi:hypothetical protein